MRKRFLSVVAPCAMTLFAARTMLLGLRSSSVRATEVSHFGAPSRLSHFRGGHTDTDATTTSTASSGKVYRTLQVQIVHRHGDRTPITPLKDEEYWAQTLIPQELLDKISSNTNVITTPGQEQNNHVAAGRGPFGKLTQLGLFQLVDLGNRLREELVSPDDQHHDDHAAYQVQPDPQNQHQQHRFFPYPWHSQRPLHPRNIKVVSTNFPRTIQSVQGLLVGLFPDGTPDETMIDIDARHTDILIPDPQPRRTPEQIALEAQLASLPQLKQRDLELKPIAVRMTQALQDSLGEGALDVAYGVGEENNDDNNNDDKNEPVLAWAQLSEITKCLQVRNRLPTAISHEDQQAVAAHTAWRWFQALQHPRLIYLAMNPLVSRMVDAMHQHQDEPPVIIYSAHDSTLIGLLCGFRLEKPIEWPEYGSYLKVELLEVTTTQPQNDDPTPTKEHVVRFSLNGNLLRSLWEDDEPQALHEIPLHVLSHKIKTVGAVA